MDNQFLHFLTIVGEIILVMLQIYNARKTKEVKYLVNGRMDQLLQNTAAASKAEGILAAKEEQKI